MVRDSCLCGGIAFEADRIALMTNCHCSKCRKVHGTAHRTSAIAERSGFRFSRGAELVASYQMDSGYRSCFCRVCGSSAPLVFEGEELVSIPAGMIDGDPGVRPALHVFVGSKAPWHEITDEAPQFETYPPGYEPADS